jgi:3-phenylpropionate/cinnamic acid dioxygenase small subunit
MLASNAVDLETHRRISEFVLLETSLLDAHRINDWIELLTEDFRYEVPVPVTPDNPARTTWADGAYLIDETRDSLANLWAKRHEDRFVEYAWGEYPRQRVRRFVSNVRISHGDEPDSYLVEANVLLTFARQSDPVSFIPGGRVDLIREEDGALRLARRVFHVDQTVITTTHMRLIF